MGYLFNSGSGYLSDAVQTASTGNYAYINEGYLKDAVQVASNRKSYLINTTGYLVDNIRIGYDDFGTRVLDDGATIESYSCAANKINTSPTANVGRQLFDAYDTRVVAASGDTEARDCTITELYNLKQ